MDGEHCRLPQHAPGMQGIAAPYPGDAPAADAYDPDLLYVECRFCGKPVLWEAGRTKAIVSATGMDTTLLDESCLILSDGCPRCRPDSPGYRMHMVRLINLSIQDMLLLGEPKGNA